MRSVGESYGDSVGDSSVIVILTPSQHDAYQDTQPLRAHVMQAFACKDKIGFSKRRVPCATTVQMEQMCEPLRPPSNASLPPRHIFPAKQILKQLYN